MIINCIKFATSPLELASKAENEENVNLLSLIDQ
jgi:hypothetical protein